MKKILFLGLALSSIAFCGSVLPANNALYQKECASCHFGYQPSLLNKIGWEKVMGNLSDHFGTDASLGKVETQELLTYLVSNAGSGKMTANNDTIYITRSSYFIKKHREIAPKLIVQKEVGSLANCMACHTSADKGNYSERNIVIPNYGSWK